MSKIVLFNPNSAVHSNAALSGLEVRKGGTILYGGAIQSGSNVSNAPIFKKMNGYGAKITATTATPNRTAKPLSGGEFAHTMATGSFQVRGLQIDLAGQRTTGLKLNGGSDFGRKFIHGASGDRRYAISSWDYETGDAVTGSNTGKRMEYRPDAETPPTLTRDAPGEFVYEEGKNLPTQDDYPARTS